MLFTTQKQFKRKIRAPLTYDIEASAEGLYVIKITARARSEKQITPSGTDDDDLRVEIDGRSFPQRNNATRYFDSPAAFSGGKLHNLKKSVHFCTYLSVGKHIINFIPDREPYLEALTVYFVGNNLGKAHLELNDQAEDGDRRPWLTFVLVDLPLKRLQAEVTTRRRFLDSDDVKLAIDGSTERNLRSLFRRFWFWVGSFLRGENQINTFETNRGQEVHYVEFSADRTPTLHAITFDFGTSTKRVPTVYDPKWTTKFSDDTEVMLLARLIFGEAEDESREAKVWVGGAVLNRITAAAWDDILHKVILQPGQYDPFKERDKNYPKTINPLQQADPLRKKAWQESYKVAQDLLLGNITNPTEATHFHGKGITRDWFIENVVPNGRFLKQIDNTHFYWSPN